MPSDPSGRKVTIEIAATGGTAAANEFKAAAAAVDSQSAAVEKYGETAEAAAGSTSKLEENVSTIARTQKAQAIAQLASEAGRLADNFRNAADEVQEFDQKAAVSLRDTARHIDAVSNGVSTVAAGYAAGGPLGSALASLGIMIQALGEKWRESELEAAKAAAKEKQAMNEVEAATRQAATAAQERAAAGDNAAILGAMDAELAKAKEITSELERQLQLVRQKRALENEALDAKDRANIEKINLDEASGKITKDEAATKRDAIEAAAKTRDRTERKTRAVEDAMLAGEDAAAKLEAAAKARETADKLSGMRDQADSSAKQLGDYVTKSVSQMVPDKKTGQLSDSDKAWAADMQAELERAQALLKNIDKATKEAEAAADKAESAAGEAVKKAGDKNTVAKNTVATMDQVEKTDADRLTTRQRIRETNTSNKQAEEDRKEREKQLKEEDARKRQEAEARTKLEQESAQIGNAAGKAAGELGARDGVVSGLKKLGETISRPGNAKGDDKALGQMVDMIDRLIHIAEKQHRGDEPAVDTLRNIQAKLKTAEERIRILEARQKNNRR